MSRSRCSLGGSKTAGCGGGLPMVGGLSRRRLSDRAEVVVGLLLIDLGVQSIAQSVAQQVEREIW
jgi:hypothetical protein